MRSNFFLLMALLIVSTPQLAVAQIKLKTAIELGLNAGGLPRISNETISNNQTVSEERYTPRISPLLGINIGSQHKKHLLYEMSLQYFQMGFKEYRHKEGLYNNNKSPYVYYSTEKQKYNCLSIPIKIGYKISIKKSALAFFVGYRLNYLMNGNYYLRSYANYRDNPEDNADLSKSLDPFDKADFQPTAKRLNAGLFSEITFSRKGRHELALSFSLNQSIRYGDMFAWNTTNAEYNNKNLALLYRYRLKKHKVTKQ
jgi:hypothetical protein